MHMSNDISIIFPSPIHMAWDPIKSSGWMLGILASLPFHLSDETPSLFNYDCESCSAGILGRDFYRVWFWKFFFQSSMDWFKGKFTGKPDISWENLWFPVKIFP